MFLVLSDGLGEEPGWRGFALPRLLERTGPMPASLVLGVVWALYHLPLFWTNQGYAQPFVIMLVELPAMAVLYIWLFQHTAGSALLAILLHASANLFMVGAVGQNPVRSAVLLLLLRWGTGRSGRGVLVASLAHS